MFMIPRNLHLSWLLAALLALPPGAGQAAGHGEVKPVAQVDPQRFAGTWYEVARLPNRFQADCASDVVARYEPQADGTLRVTNSCRTPTGKLETDVGRAWSVEKDRRNVARLKVSFMPRWLQWLPVARGDFWVVSLDADYRTAVVSDPQRQHLWVLARTPDLPPRELGRIVDRLSAQGYPTDQLVLTRQSAALRSGPALMRGGARARLIVDGAVEPVRQTPGAG